MKTLDSYFDDWTHVELGFSRVLVTEVRDWCEQQFGVRGLKWDCYHKPGKRGQAALLEVYRFKNEGDAVLFSLKWL